MVYVTIYTGKREVRAIPEEQITSLPVKSRYNSPVGILRPDQMYKTESAAWRSWNGDYVADDQFFND